MATYYVDGAVGSDANAGTSPGTGNAWATIAHATATAVAGDVIYVKASATYAISASVTLANSGGNTTPIALIGYSTVPGDGGIPTLQATTSLGSNGIITLNKQSWVFRNLILDANSQANTSCFGAVNNAAGDCRFDEVAAINFTTAGFTLNSATQVLRRCFASGTGVGFSATSNTFLYDLCTAKGCSSGFDGGFSSFTRCLCIGCGIGLSQVDGNIRNCTFYNNGTAINISPNSAQSVTLVQNCVFANQSSAALTCNSATSTVIDEDYNAFFSNTGGSYGSAWKSAAGGHDTNLTGNPFINPSATINSLADAIAAFALNNTAGAGAACRGAGYPTNLDIGAVQSAASGAGGGGLLLPRGFTGGFAA